MAFDVAADSYSRFMGRFSEPLSLELLALLAPQRGQRALDVGCGPGILTAPLVGLLGPESVAAVDPSESFVASTRERLPGVDVRRSGAEHLPFDDDTVDLAVAQLVVQFMDDPVAGLAEMARVTRPGGTVAASVWDHAGGRGPLSPLWEAVATFDPGHTGESDRAGVRDGHLVELFEAAGLSGVHQSELSVTVGFASFEEWWDPFLLGVGTAGDYVAGLHARGVEAVRQRCADLLPPAPFALTVIAWCVTGTA